MGRACTRQVFAARFLEIQRAKDALRSKEAQRDAQEGP